MQTNATFGYEQIVTELIRGVLDTVADKPGLSPERKAAAQQTVVCSVMAFNPRDPIETIMAGHCMIYDHMLHDGARDMLRGQSELIKMKVRPGILSCGKMFLATVDTLCRMQGRAEDQLAFARKIEAPPAPAVKPAETAHDAGVPEPVAMRELRTSNGTGTANPAPAAPEPPPAVPPTPAVSPKAAGPTIAREAALPSGPATPPMNVSDRPAAARASGQAAPERRQGAIVAPAPATQPLMSEEMITEVLLNGLDPAEQQSIRDAVARATRGAV